MTNQVLKLTLIVGIVVLLVGCAASRAFVRGEKAARVGDWDAAVEYYRQAVQDDPDRAEYKIAYERATFAAAAQHADRGRRAEEEGRLEEALREYRRASELDSSNRQVASKMGEIERILRERIEAARPKPQIDRLREEARKVAPEPLLSPTSPLGPVRFENANARDVLNFIGESTGINVLFDREFTDRTITINVEGVTLEEALQQIMITNQMFYKVLNERTIIVAQDSTVKRNQYEDQVVRTFFLSHADATEMQQLLITIIRIAGMAVQPQFVANKTTNTLTARASTSVMAIIEKMLEANDKPRAEIIIDVQILEVSRERAKQYGLNLSSYAIGGIFSPEVAPATGDQGISNQFFNLNTISQGVSTADFYLSVPSARAQLPRKRLAHEGAGQAAAARHRRPEGDAQPRRRRPDSLDDLHADRDRRRRGQPADVVRLPPDRHHRGNDAARDLRGRDHPRAHAGEQRPRRRRHHRRPGAAGIQLAQSDDQAAAA